MAVQGNNGPGICPLCSARYPAGAVTCPDCGAPVNGGTAADAESAIYPDIARANLSRMRGDYKAAEDQLLAILRQYPNNPVAQELMGDLAMEREDTPRALEWYEMAFAIVPSSAALAKKLKAARGGLDQQQTDQTVQQLGIDRGTSSSPIMIALAVVAVLVVGVSAYFLGAARGHQPISERPIKVLTADPQPETNGTPPTDAAPKPQNETARGAQASDDMTLLQALQAKAADGGSILAVRHDPRTRAVIIDFNYGGQNGREVAARIAKDALAADPNSLLATLRGVSGGALVYIADVHKNRLAEVAGDQWSATHQDNPAAWIDHVLSNEWPAPSSGGTASEGPAGVPPGEAGSVSPPVETTGAAGQ